MTAPWRLLALPPLGENVISGMFADLGDAVEIAFPASRDRPGLLAAIPDAEVVITDFTGQLVLDADVVAKAGRLAFVQFPGVGTDNGDVAALRAAGVAAANCAGANARSVAEWSLGAAFTLCRGIAQGDRLMRAGGWPQLELLARGPRELHTQRIGVVGFGAVGSEVATLFGALGCAVSYWSRRRRPTAPAAYRELDALIESSDILVITLPMAPETAGLIDAARLARLPDDALLINVGRGGIVRDGDVLAALESGRLAGAALDVFEDEPPAADHPLRAQENVLLSPHLAGATRQAQLNIASTVRDNVAAVITGRPVINIVNGMAPLIRRRG